LSVVLDQRPSRVIALGASNLTRALYSVVSMARAAWPGDLEFVAALGLGRSYGMRSSVFGRAVPGILESGLWRHVETAAPAESIGLVTDVGNDIMYNVEVREIVAWVREATERLERHARTVVISGLPVEGARTLTDWQFRLLRYVVVPSCRLTHDELASRARAVNDALRDLAAARGHRFVELDSSWYGFDPIHIRHRHWRTAWSRMLGVPEDIPWRGSLAEGIGLHLRRPAEESVFGIPMGHKNQGRPLPRGGRVWLF
jgi:hypothetical protein